MKRREFIAGLGSATAWPVVARAQQTGPMRRIGVLTLGEGDPERQSWIAAFQQGLEQIDGAVAAAHALGREIVVVSTRNEDDIQAAFATFVERKVGALVVGAFPLFASHREEIVALAARHKIPAIYQDREYAVAGGLMSYGGNYREATRLAAIYVGQILKGAKPADLPVMQTTKFELVINIRTAKALGLQVPSQLVALADEVIE
jgi:putative ABC transport system substrate-binding protein